MGEFELEVRGQVADGLVVYRVVDLYFLGGPAAGFGNIIPIASTETEARSKLGGQRGVES
jgi:hypothetical protein